MSYKFSSLSKNAVNWQDGSPVSSTYDDIYFSKQDAVAESTTTFLNGVDLDSLWQERTHVTIAETGFGTGLNFLLTWQRWKQLGSPGNLTYISVEGHPLDLEALTLAHQAFPELSDMAHDLQSKWPPAAPGYHLRLFEDGKLALLLLFGDAKKQLSQLQASVDAWYLDGFSPASNPDMWNDAIFTHIARTAKPACRLATFTAAGFVKRGLQAVGFDMKKAPGYGKKRERLVGIYNGNDESSPWQGSDWTAPPQKTPGSTLVIGAGIAGVSVASALKRLGQQVTIIDSPTFDKASEVPVAILSPHLLKEATPRARFISNSFSHSLSRSEYQQTMLEPKGLELHSKSPAEAERHRSLANYLDWSPDWIEWREDHLALDRSGTIKSQEVLALLSDDVECIEGHASHLKHNSNGWEITLSDGRILKADTVVIAAGINSHSFPELSGIALRPNRGQICLIEDEDLDQPNKKTLSFGGYLSPAFDHSGKTIRLLGSTFAQWTFNHPDWKVESDKDYQHILNQYLEGIAGATPPSITSPETWIGMRGRTFDSLPFAGPVPDWEDYINVFKPLAKDSLQKIKAKPPYIKGLYAITGMGSKGFQHGPLAGEVVASMIAGTPLPVEADILKCLHPAKATIRSLIRQEFE